MARLIPCGSGSLRHIRTPVMVLSPRTMRSSSAVKNIGLRPKRTCRATTVSVRGSSVASSPKMRRFAVAYTKLPRATIKPVRWSILTRSAESVAPLTSTMPLTATITLPPSSE